MPTVSDWGCSPEALKAAGRIASIVILGLVLFLVIFCLKTCSSPSLQTGGVISSAPPVYIPTVRQLQEALCEAGYTVEVDCVVGDETKAAWNAYCADREAAKYINPKKEK